jgi:deoxyhypusine synthase
LIFLIRSETPPETRFLRETGFLTLVFSEATVALPLIAGYAYGKGNWRDRSVRRLAQLFDSQLISA